MQFAIRTLAALGLLLLAPLAAAQTPTVTVSADITSDTDWTADQVYLLDGLVFVRPGATLSIEAGTVIKGAATPSAGTGDLASGLVVMVDGVIEAEGTLEDPIIFTAEADNVDNSLLDENDRGLWGGVIILGRSTTNATPAITNVEGIPPSDDTRFGCDGATFVCDEAHSSGTLTFVSVRHAGFGFEQDSEINGVTFGAVGSGTVVEHVEVFANSDDAFEFFGGTVRAKYLVGAFNGDDTFDTDRGFRGAFQYGFSINNPGNDAGRCFENDGGVSSLGGEDATPYSVPVYTNITCFGAGQDADPTQLGEEQNTAALQLRDNTGGKIYNSIFANFPGTALNLEALSSGEDTENRFGQNTEADDLTIRNNTFFAFGGGSTFADLVDDDGDNSGARQGEIESLMAAANTIGDPGIPAAGYALATLDPRPTVGSAADGSADFSFSALGDDFFEEVDYIGAFAPGEPVWLRGWTKLAQGGYLTGEATPTVGGPSVTFALAVSPNPTAGDATVRFSLDRAQQARIALYDVLGREVAVVAEGRFAAGEASARVATSELPAGVYVLRLQGEGAAASRQISVVR